MKNLFSKDIRGLKYICLCSDSYENALFYHSYFNMNEAIFIEAPLLCSGTKLNETSYKNNIYNGFQVLLTTNNTKFYESTRNLFGLVKQESIFNKSKFIRL